jgi:predicted nuclease of predicted toxin-antitoxin system
MKILLDECLPKKLKKAIINHEVVTVPEKGWAGTKNGKLLKLASENFDVFITVDQNLTSQQNLKQIDLIIIVLVSKDNRFITLKPLITKVNKILENLKKGDVISLE